MYVYIFIKKKTSFKNLRIIFQFDGFYGKFQRITGNDIVNYHNLSKRFQKKTNVYYATENKTT